MTSHSWTRKVDKVDRCKLTFGQLSSEDLDFSGKEPVDHGNGLGLSVIGGNDNIDILEW